MGEASDSTAKKMDLLFTNRRDVYAVQTDNGKWCKVDEELTLDVLERHLDAKLTAGIYQLDERDEVRWICLDFDDKDAESDARKVLTIIKSTEFAKAALLEHTGGRGLHVWIFFANMVPAWQAKKIAKKLVERASVRCEIFPKQARIGKGGHGSLVRIPLGVHKKTGQRSRFIDPQDLDDVVPIVVEPEAVNDCREPVDDHGHEPHDHGHKPHDHRHEASPCWGRMFRGVSEGARNDVTFALARRLRFNNGFDEELCTTTLVTWNKSNSPPLPEHEVLAAIKSVYGKEYSNIGCDQIKDNDVLRQFCDEDTCQRHRPNKNAPHASVAAVQLDKMDADVLSTLADPSLLETLVHDLGKCGIVGEPGNVVTVLLVLNSRLCEQPLNLSPSGESGVGKSFLVCQVSDLFEHCTLVIGYMSRTSLIHDTEWAEKLGDNKHKVNLTGKVLVILETESSREFMDLMKPIRSHDKKEVSYAITEGEGKHHAKKVILRGWPVFITLSVNPSKKQEDLTRDLNLTPAYSDKKGRAVNLKRGETKEAPWKFPTDRQHHDSKAKWAAALQHLRPLKVINPYARKLAEKFDTKNPRSMRDFEKVCSLFESSVLLHQYQRVTIHAKNGEVYLIGTIDDLNVTMKVVKLLLQTTTTGLRSDVLKAYDDFFKVQCPPGGAKTVNDILKEWNGCFGRTIARSTLIESYLQPLYAAGLLNKDETSKAHKYEVCNLSDVSKPVGFDVDTFSKAGNLTSGLKDQLVDLFTSVGVSTVTRRDVVFPIDDTDSMTQMIVGAVQTPTLRQEFINKLSDPLASCLKDEEKISVGGLPTHPDSSDTSQPGKGLPDLDDKVAGVCEDCRNGIDLKALESKWGVEAVRHCSSRGLIPIIGGRGNPSARTEAGT